MKKHPKAEPIAEMFDGQVWFNKGAYDRLAAELAEANNRITALTGPILLVPQTEVDADEVVNLAYWLAKQLGEHVDCQTNESLVDTIQRLLDQQRDITEWLIAEAVWQNAFESELTLADANNRIVALIGPNYVAPSLPAVDSPEGLRYAANVLDEYDRTNGHGCDFGDLRREADRLEREQAEKAKRDKVIEEMAQVLHSDDERRSGSAYPIAWLESSESNRDAFRSNARALLDRFDITPKQAGE